jgi:hypothetical protein
MTNQRRRDKESSAGCHRKRTKPRVTESTLGYGDVSTAPARVAKREASTQIISGARFFIPRDQFISCRIAGVLPLEAHRDPIVPS